MVHDMGDVDGYSWLLEVIYLFVVNVVTWVKAVALYCRHMNVLSLVTYLFGLLRSFGSLAPC
jgi:hypothetical protein